MQIKVPERAVQGGMPRYPNRLRGLHLEVRQVPARLFHMSVKSDQNIADVSQIR